MEVAAEDQLDILCETIGQRPRTWCTGLRTAPVPIRPCGRAQGARVPCARDGRCDHEREYRGGAHAIVRSLIVGRALPAFSFRSGVLDPATDAGHTLDRRPRGAAAAIASSAILMAPPTAVLWRLHAVRGRSRRARGGGFAHVNAGAAPGGGGPLIGGGVSHGAPP